MRHVISILFLTVCLSLSAQVMPRYPYSKASAASEEVDWSEENLVGHWSLQNGDLTDQHGSDDMSSTNAVNSGDSCFYFDGTAYLSFTGTTNTEATFMMKVWTTTTASSDLFGATVSGGMECYTYSTTLRPRIYGHGGGSSVPSTDVAWTVNQWCWVTFSISDAGNTVEYGTNGVYETETDWTQTTDQPTDRIGTYSVGANFVGYIAQIWKFSDIKSQSYKDAMEDRYYEDGPPE